jgi:hypothetical protein
MAALRLARCTIDPADAEEVLAERAALVAAVRDAVPGRIQARLTKVDDQTWTDVWRWDSRASAQTAIATAPAIPEAPPALWQGGGQA